jgi:hypothetical protein
MHQHNNDGLLEEYRKAAPLCDKHKPKGGTRPMCLICILEGLASALSEISYACEEPNEYQCSSYDLHCNEEIVIKQVQQMRERLRAYELKEAERNKQTDLQASQGPPQGSYCADM